MNAIILAWKPTIEFSNIPVPSSTIRSNSPAAQRGSVPIK
jgi:hypothetical protein